MFGTKLNKVDRLGSLRRQLVGDLLQVVRHIRLSTIPGHSVLQLQLRPRLRLHWQVEMQFALHLFHHQVCATTWGIRRRSTLRVNR